MTMLPATSRADLANELEANDTPTLRAQLAESLAVTAGQLVRMALIVRTLEGRGEDLSDLKVGLLGYLRLIAAGQLVPELVVRFAEHPLLMSKLRCLPVPDQDRLAGGSPVTLVVPAPSGGYDKRLADPGKLTREQVHQVFAPEHLRDEPEQILILEARRSRPLRAKKTAPSGRARPDPERGGVVVGRSFACAADILEALARLRQPEAEEENNSETTTLGVRLSVAELRRLRILAAQGNRSVPDLVRSALRAAGLI